MSLAESIALVKEHFGLDELVSREVMDRYGEQAWTFFDPRALETLYVIRHDILKVPMTINNWKGGGRFSQRGLRANMDSMMLEKAEQYYNAKSRGAYEAELRRVRMSNFYMSAHSLGNGFDFTCGKMTPDEIRAKLIECQDQLPYQIRMESSKGAPTWVHIDMENATKDKIQIF